ncbi:hypothetical protein AB5I41_07895 [Sphingomonas sp. MMS24-JH45]
MAGHAAQGRGELDFPRGYHIEMGGGRSMPGMGLADWLDDGSGGRGPALRASMRRRYGSVVRMSSRGEMVPNEDSFCDIDPENQGSLRHPGAALSLEMGRA